MTPSKSEFGVRRELLKFLPGAILFGAGLAVQHLFGGQLPGLSPVLYLCAYVLVGWNVLGNGIRSLFRRAVLDEFVLMSLATLGALAIGAFAEAVAVMLFYNIGEIFQEAAVHRSRQSVASLLQLRPETARVVRDGQPQTVDPAQVQVGEVIRIQAGERVPLDGTIQSGAGRVDTSALTGESRSRRVSQGETILAGMVNLSGLLTVRVDKPLAESTVSVILDLVQNAAQRKAPTEQFITKVARIYTPVVVGLAALIAFGPVLVSHFPGGASLFATPPQLADWVYKGLVFLVISCPCALVISIPLGFFGGIGAGSRQGILIKGANFLEGLNRLGAVVWDKTGTLTQGSFAVQDIDPKPGFSPEEVLALAAGAEHYSSHPIARAIVQAAGSDLPAETVEGVEETSGQGVKAMVSTREVLVGNREFLRSQGIGVDTGHPDQGQVFVAVGGEFAGRILIRDTLRPQATAAVDELRRLGVKTQVMLTGDSREVAEQVKQDLGLDGVESELLPQDKVRRLESIMEKTRGDGLTAYVGDGINDAPVLARSDIGVAMGGLGSDAAIEAADVVLMEDDPGKLSLALSLAARTRAIVWENIGLALGVKAGVMILGVMGLVSMWAAVFADVGVALLAVGNSWRVIR